MANLSKIIYINEEDYSTLINGDTITKDGQTYSYDESALYVIKNVSTPEYAETAGYATRAGTANAATHDGAGNIIAPLIIEANDTDTTVPSGTYDSITTALSNGRKVFVKVNIDQGEGNVDYCILPLVEKFYIEGDEDSYYFSASEYSATFNATIFNNDDFGYSVMDLAQTSHYHGYIQPNGTLQTTSDITIANGDKLVVTDADDSNTIVRASLTFDGSTTTQFLSKKGTWETVSTQLSSDYTVPAQASAPVANDTLETAIGKLHKAILEDEEVTAVALNDLNNRISTQIQADWDESDSSDDAYIRNKPDLSEYNKAPLIIEVGYTDTTVPSGTYTNIGNALTNDREVYIKMNGDDYSVYYLKLEKDLSDGRSGDYCFSGGDIFCSIWGNDELTTYYNTYAAEDHYHGDIDNLGTLNESAPISIANGDRIVITDASNNDKIQKTSITFDGSTTTTALTPKGTWEGFLPSTGGEITGDLVFRAAAGQNSPSLIFQRGTLSDNYNDWLIQDRAGYLYFDQRGSGATLWSNQVYFDTAGNIHGYIDWSLIKNKPTYTNDSALTNAEIDTIWDNVMS